MLTVTLPISPLISNPIVREPNSETPPPIGSKAKYVVDSYSPVSTLGL